MFHLTSRRINIVYLIALLVSVQTAFGQRTPVNFTAACLNVDGLPQKISLFKVNPDGPGEGGTIKLSQQLAQQNWDFFGVSEDFNYHTELSSSLTNYWIGAHRAEIGVSALGASKSNPVDTDGLCFFVKNGLAHYPDGVETSAQKDKTWYVWEERVGSLTNGADEVIAKGFRFYQVTVGSGDNKYVIDVYVHHMNSEDNEAAVNAKHWQLNKLFEIIRDRTITNQYGDGGEHPIIIMGDTNCRYTREKLKEVFIDAFNNLPQYQIIDPWIEIKRGGIYPICQYPVFDGAGVTVADEVVDKIFIINNRASGVELLANTYENKWFYDPDDSTKKLADHGAIVLNLTIKEKEYNQDEPLGPTPQESGVFEGTYYLQNVETGLYLHHGAKWGTQAIVDHVGFPIQFITQENGYLIKNPRGYFSEPSNEIYVDKNDSDNETRIWEVKSIGDYVIIGNNNQYLYVKDSSGAIAGDSKQDISKYLWRLVKAEDRKAELDKANSIIPQDASFLMASPRFNIGDQANIESSWTKSLKYNAKQECENWNDGGENRNWMLRLYNSDVTLGYTTEWTVSNTISDLPNGKYILSFDLLTSAFGSLTFKINGNEIAKPSSSDFPAIDGSTSYATAMQLLRDNPNNYRYTINNIVVTNGQLSMSFDKGSNTSATATHFDNFQLIYLGPTEVSTQSLIDSYTTIYNKAQGIKDDKMGATEKAALTAAMVEPSSLQTQDAIYAASDLLNNKISDAETSIALYKNANLVIQHRRALTAVSNFFTDAAVNTYQAATDQFVADYDNGTIAALLDDPYVVSGWHDRVDCSDLLMSVFRRANDFNEIPYINTWSTEGEKDGSDFICPFYEYWTGDDNSLGTTSFTASAQGLTAGRNYTVTALVRVRLKNGESKPTGITIQATGGAATSVTDGAQIGTSQFYLARYAVTGTADASGMLSLTFNIADDNNISWLSFKELNYLEPNEVMMVDVPSNAPNTVYQDGSTLKSKEIILTDAEKYENEHEIEAETVTYTRTFGHANWQAFCLPVEMPLGNLDNIVAKSADNHYEVLQFIGIGIANGEPAAQFSLVDKAETSLMPNTPYIIKPISTGSLTFTLSNTSVMPAEVVVLESEGWCMVSNYLPVKGLYSENSYVVSGGAFKQVANDDVTLNPFRVRLVPPKESESQVLRINVESDTEGVTDIINDREDGIFYDLQGRAIEHPTPGLYIFNGMKVIIK